MTMTPFIVAEVSTNWVNGQGTPIAHRFEEVIEFNRQRGYVLHSFQFHQMTLGPDTLIETIVAVFQQGATLVGALDETIEETAQ